MDQYEWEIRNLSELRNSRGELVGPGTKINDIIKVCKEPCVKKQADLSIVFVVAHALTEIRSRVKITTFIIHNDVEAWRFCREFYGREKYLPTPLLESMLSAHRQSFFA